MILAVALLVFAVLLVAGVVAAAIAGARADAASYREAVRLCEERREQDERERRAA